MNHSATERHRRTIMQLILVFLAFIVALRLGILSVPIFMAAALVHLLFQRRHPVHPRNSSAWARLTESPLQNRSCPTRATKAVITYHPWYQNFAPDLVDTCLKEAVAAGAAYIRTDIRWCDLLPDGHSMNREACAWYRAYFNAIIHRHGLKPIAILSGPPSNLTSLDAGQKLEAWRTYVELAVSEVGDACTTYQVLNEPNNPVYRIFTPARVPEAIATAAHLIKTRNPAAEVVVNILAGVPGWKSHISRITAQIQGIDVVGFDYFPGTWTVSPFSDRHQMQAFLDDVGFLLANPKIELNQIAIFETGYSANVPLVRSESRQAEYFGMLRHAINENSKHHAGSLISYVGVYELCDSNSERLLDPEAHFGILRSSTFERKPAFEAVRQLFASL
jgi:hypothetical protein